MILADITLVDILWSMFVFFMFFIWIMILFQIFGDLFRDHEESGFAKVVWVLVLILAPFLGAFIYLIVRGNGMAQRAMKAQAEAQQQFDAYVKNVAGSGDGGGDSADQIAKAKQLLDSGAIDQAEFDRLKAKALG